MTEDTYQLEVKAALVESMFRPSDGWRVSVDVDAMERAYGGDHPTGKRERAAKAERRLGELGVHIGPHKTLGRADVVAEHPSRGTYVVEVEGDSSRQPDQAMYSALGQALMMMSDQEHDTTYAVAVPDREDWLRQLRKVPAVVARMLNLKLFAVGSSHVREVSAVEVTWLPARKLVALILAACALLAVLLIWSVEDLVFYASARRTPADLWRMLWMAPFAFGGLAMRAWTWRYDPSSPWNAYFVRYPLWIAAACLLAFAAFHSFLGLDDWLFYPTSLLVAFVVAIAPGLAWRRVEQAASKGGS